MGWGVMARDEVRGKRCFGTVGNVRSEWVSGGGAEGGGGGQCEQAEQQECRYGGGAHGGQ